MMGSKCPYTTANEVSMDLQKLVFSENHVKPYARALLDARLAKIAKDAYDAVYEHKTSLTPPRIPEYAEIEEEAKKELQSAVADGTWCSKCKGRDLLKAYCSQHGLKYEHFRNLLIASMKTPPEPLAKIMSNVLKN